MPESPQPPIPEWLQPAVQAGARHFENEQRIAREQGALAKKRRLERAGETMLRAEYGAQAQAEAETLSADIIRLFIHHDIEPYPQPSYKFKDHAQAVRFRNVLDMGRLTHPVPPKRPRGQSESTNYWGWDIANGDDGHFLEAYTSTADTVAGGLFLEGWLGLYRVSAQIGVRWDEPGNYEARKNDKYTVQRVVWDPKLYEDLVKQGEKVQLFPTLYPKVHHVCYAHDKTHDPGAEAILAGHVTDENKQHNVFITAEQAGLKDLGKPRLPDRMLGHVTHASWKLVSNFSDRTSFSFSLGDRLLETNMRAMAVSHGAFNQPQ